MTSLKTAVQQTITLEEWQKIKTVEDRNIYPRQNELKVPLPHLVPKKGCKRTKNAILIISVALVWEILIIVKLTI